MSEDEETALRAATSLSPTPRKSRFSLSLGKKKNDPSPRASRMSLSSLAAILSPKQFSKLRLSSTKSTPTPTDGVVPEEAEDVAEDNEKAEMKKKKETEKKAKKQKSDDSGEDSWVDEESSSSDEESSEEGYNDGSSRAAHHNRISNIPLSSDDDDSEIDTDDEEGVVPRSIPRRRPPKKSAQSLVPPSRRASDPYMGDTRKAKMQASTQNRFSTSNLRQSRQVDHPEAWKPSHAANGPNFVGSDNLKDWKPAEGVQPDMGLKEDDFRTVLVYKKPPMGESLPILDDNENGNKTFQGVWASEVPQVQNPTEVWLFHMDDKPDGLEESTARFGYWAFNPAVEIEDDNFAPEDLWVYPPGALMPKRVEAMGVWIYPRLLAETNTIAPGSSGFIDLVKTQKIGKLGVGGMWKVHYSKDSQPPKPDEASPQKQPPKKIFQVKIMTGKGDESVTIFPLKGTDTVWDVRCKLAKRNAELPSDQSLMMNGELLEDDVTLENYGIGHNTVLEMEGMKLYVQDWDKRFFEIRVAPDDTVAMTKELISNLINIPAKMLRISFEKALLSKEDGKLQKYGLHHFARIKLEPIQLFLHESNTEPVKIPVLPVDTVHQVKQRVSQKLNAPLDTTHRLYLEDGTELLDGFHLADFDVQQGSVLRTSAFSISIQDPSTGEMCSVDVGEGATVGDVKFAYLERKGVPIAHQNLYYNKTGPLDSAKTLIEYRIQNGAVLSLLTLPPFEIEVISEEGEAVGLVADPTDLLEELKEQIQEAFGIPTTKQVIRLRKRRLKGNLSLAEYGIKDGCSVEVVRVKTFS